MASRTSDIVFLLRPWFWLPGIASGIAGSLWAESGSASITDLVVTMIVLGPGICAFAEIFNDLSDVDFDKEGTQKRFLGVPMSGGSGVLVEGKHEAFLLGKVLRNISLIIGVCACVLLPPRVAPFILGGYLLAWAYSGSPLRGKHRGIFGICLQGLGYGPVAFYIGYSVSQPFTLDEGLLISVLIGMWTALVGLTADILDYEQDAGLGIKTYVVSVGPKKSTCSCNMWWDTVPRNSHCIWLIDS